MKTTALLTWNIPLLKKDPAKLNFKEVMVVADLWEHWVFRLTIFHFAIFLTLKHINLCQWVMDKNYHLERKPAVIIKPIVYHLLNHGWEEKNPCSYLHHSHIPFRIFTITITDKLTNQEVLPLRAVR